MMCQLTTSADHARENETNSSLLNFFNSTLELFKKPPRPSLFSSDWVLWFLVYPIAIFEKRISLLLNLWMFECNQNTFLSCCTFIMLNELLMFECNQNSFFNCCTLIILNNLFMFKCNQNTFLNCCILIKLEPFIRLTSGSSEQIARLSILCFKF